MKNGRSFPLGYVDYECFDIRDYDGDAADDDPKQLENNKLV